MAVGDAAQLSDLPTYFGNILSAAIPLIGVIAFLMILSGGFKILTAGSDTKNLEAGKQIITLAVVGIALAIISWLVLLAIQTITGVQVTQFKFGF